MTAWLLRYEDRPWNLNAERSMHWREHGHVTKEWRHAFALLARAHRIPRLEVVTFDVTPIWPNRRALPDAAAGALAPAVKAAIDGLVDAGVIPDDTDVHVLSTTYHRTRLVPGARHALELKITEATPHHG